MKAHKIWYMCKYTPLELFAGFSCEMQRIESVTDSFEFADAAAHPNLCGYGKALLEACAQPGVDEIVLVNCCDVARRVYDVLKEQGGKKFLYLLDLPHTTGRAETWMFESTLRRLVSAYEKYSGLHFDAEKAWKVLNTDPKEPEETPYISLQGAHGGPALLKMVSSHFRVPVRDDTCSGNRRLHPLKKPENADEFLHYYASDLLGQLPCMRMQEMGERAELGRDAAGIVYHTMKFCDYYGFDYADRVRQGRIPNLKIETDTTRQSEGQLATRLDAFAESLRLDKRAGGRKRGAGLESACGREKDTMSRSEWNYVAGVDSGSTSTDVVIMDRDRKLIAWTIQRTGAGAAAGAERALAEAVRKAGIREDEIGTIVSTGYGRETIGIGDDAVTEITCHAKGAHYLDPDVRTIIDIGGQDSKVIRIDGNGAVRNFTMNDKCAAGTGRFLEMMARTLEISMEDMEKLGGSGKEDVTISSMCTVFAESEVVSLVAKNTALPDVIHGLNKSVAVKTASLVRRVGMEEAVMMTGGVAKNTGLVRELENHVGTKIRVSQYAQLCGAIGAALIALGDA
jgi:predicted CoA-substrate-specific enzyme activase